MSLWWDASASSCVTAFSEDHHGISVLLDISQCNEKYFKPQETHLHCSQMSFLNASQVALVEDFIFDMFFSLHTVAACVYMCARVHACVLFHQTEPDKWKTLPSCADWLLKMPVGICWLSVCVYFTEVLIVVEVFMWTQFILCTVFVYIQ